MINKVTDGLTRCLSLYGDYSTWPCAQCAYVKDKTSGQCQYELMKDSLAIVQKQGEEIKELREVIQEMSMNGGTGTQQGVCRYLIHIMDGIEKRLYCVGQEE